jgi:hypothetical protein
MGINGTGERILNRAINDWNFESTIAVDYMGRRWRMDYVCPGIWQVECSDAEGWNGGRRVKGDIVTLCFWAESTMHLGGEGVLRDLGFSIRHISVPLYQLHSLRPDGGIVALPPNARGEGRQRRVFAEPDPAGGVVAWSLLRPYQLPCVPIPIARQIKSPEMLYAIVQKWAEQTLDLRLNLNEKALSMIFETSGEHDAAIEHLADTTGEQA